MRIIALGNQKGGVGKTTTAYNLAYALHERGRRVVMVDLDPQASLTVSAGVGECAGRSLAEVLAGSLKIADVLQELGAGLALVPGDIALSEAELILTGKIGREWKLKTALGQLAGRFDYALLDLPPSLGVLTVNGLAAAHQVIIPAIPQYLDLRALAIFRRTVDQVKDGLNPGLTIAGILPTFYDSRVKLHEEVLRAWQASGLPIYPVRVRRSIRYAEGPIAGEPMTTYSPEHGEVYRELAEIIDHA